MSDEEGMSPKSELSPPLAPARVAPPVDPRPPFLPFHDPNFTWEHFQRLCAAVARAEGYTHVEVYGRRGQKQYGIDIYGTRPGHTPSVYQARWVDDLTPRHVSDAVDDYVREGLRLTARRFVLAVACSTAATRLTDRVVELRAKYPELEIELYGRERLSDLLRDRPDVVGAFFGDGWVRAFCATTEPGTRLDAEALLRGPVNALHLSDAVRDAAEREETDPADAAVRYDAVAARLEENYPLQAATYREKAARALGRGSRWDDAFDRWFSLAWRDLWDRARPRPSGTYDVGFEESVPHVDPVRVARFRVIEAWHRWHEDASQRQTLAASFDELHRAGDSFAARAAVLFVEAHLVDQDLEPIRARRKEVSELCATLNSPEKVRLRVALADADGEAAWSALFGAATSRELPLRDAAYVALRAGRWYAWAGDFDQAEAAYRRAIEQAEAAYRRAIELGAEARLELDVGGALWALTVLYTKSARFHDRIQATNVMALSIDGTRSYVPHYPHTRENALRELSSERGPDAHMWLRHQLWEALVGGKLGDELETLRDLGRLYAGSGFPELALDAYLRAGDGEGAERLCREFAGWVDITAHLRVGPMWRRRAAMQAITAEGELVPDSEAQGLVTTLVSLLGGDEIEVVALAAKVAGSIAYQLDLEGAMRITDAFLPYGPRARQQYRLTDPGMLTFAARSYQRHPQLRDRLAALILEVTQGGLVDGDLRQAVLGCRDDLRPLTSLLVPLADAGNPAASELLGLLGVEHRSVVERGRLALSEIIALRPAHERSEHILRRSYAVPKTVLAEAAPADVSAYAAKLVAIALDPDEMVMNRSGALYALMETSPVLTVVDKQRSFASVFPLVRGTQLSRVEQWQQQTNHPLSRFRFNFGTVEDVQAAGISAAVMLATAAEEREQVLAAAGELLGRPDLAPALAFMFVRLAESGPSIEPALLAGAPHAALRQAAVAIWSKTLQPRELGLQFAADQALGVRIELARNLGAIGRMDPEVEAELRSKLRADASGSVRHVAARRDAGAERPADSTV